MKRFLSKFSLVIVLSLIIMMLPVFPSAASADEARYGKTILGKLNNSAALIYAYETLADGCKDAKSSISLQSSKHKITWDELTTVFSAVFYDYPEYFWLTGGCSGSIDGGSGAVVSVSPGYTMTGSALTAAKTSFESVSKNLLTGLTGKSDYEISLILHDRLAEHTSYVSTKNDQNAYGALVEKKAVCAGYARAYQHLMLRAGIPAWVVTGNSVNPATNNYEGHEWNVVSLDGKWYYTDVTWDDQDDTIFHAYLNLTSKQIDEDHIAVDFKNYIPNATATDANYFVKNGLIHSSFNAENVANALKKGNNTANMYVTGDVDKFKDSITSNLSSIINAMNIGNVSGYSYSMQSLGREVIFSVNIIAAGHTHKLTSVAKKAATCSSSGNTAYYTCSCGKWFSDSAAKNEITDKDSVVTKAPRGGKTTIHVIGRNALSAV